jgi:hypothetical protein
MSFIKRRKRKSKESKSKSSIDSFLKETPILSIKNDTIEKKKYTKKADKFLNNRKQKLKEEYKLKIKRAQNLDESARPEKILGGDFRK